jgi:hypothetical protein
VAWVRDMDFDEDRSQVRTASGPRVLDLVHQERHVRAFSAQRGLYKYAGCARNSAVDTLTVGTLTT